VASTTQPFHATFEGTFDVPGSPGNSGPVFYVDETGSGTEATLGAFSYTTHLTQNTSHEPNGDCGEFSSSDVDGKAMLSFAGGDLNLRRSSGDACFNYPMVEATERWVIVGGSGTYRGTTGTLTRHWTGDVTTGAAEGTMDGTIRLH
jgi:hypothetical protein